MRLINSLSRVPLNLQEQSPRHKSGLLNHVPFGVFLDDEKGENETGFRNNMHGKFVYPIRDIIEGKYLHIDLRVFPFMYEVYCFHYHRSSLTPEVNGLGLGRVSGVTIYRKFSLLGLRNTPRLKDLSQDLMKLILILS